MTLGKIETERGRPREAVAALREASRLEPSSPRLKKWLAEAAAAAAQSPR
jgi:cytochrome c-type biogenesis protein CcmH/NrfG